MPFLSWEAILNPRDEAHSRPENPSRSAELVDVKAQLETLAQLATSTNLLPAPILVQDALHCAINYFSMPLTASLRTATILPGPSRSLSPPSTSSPVVQYHVSINRETTLDVLYFYPQCAFIEYPETSAQGRIGHLLTLDPENWSNPVSTFAYSQGKPSGQSKKNKPVYCNVLVDGSGQKVVCREFHTTCTFVGLKSIYLL